MTIPVRFLTTRDDVRLAYCVHGEGPPYVLSRGWITHLEHMWNADAFRSFFEALARHFTIVRYDGRGNGLSERRPPSLDLDALVLDLEAVVDEVTTGEIVLHGSCFGGPVAIAYATRHPERVSHLILDGTFARGAEIMSADRRDAFLETVRTFPEAGFLFVSNVTARNLPSRHPRALREAVTPETAAALYRLAFSVDLADVLPALTMPTLVLHRRNTRSIPVYLGRQLAASVPDARWVMVEGDAQNIWSERPEDSLRAIGEFLGVPLAVPAAADVLAARPSRTILMTDIEGSTALTGRLGDAGGQALVRLHNEVVRDALQQFDGREVKHTGDGIMAWFASASMAVSCAVAIQRRLAEREDGIRIRVGVNTGEPIAEDDDLFGTAVQVTARVTDTAEPGQILATDVVRQLLAGVKEHKLRPVGEATLKGIEEPVLLYEVDWS